MLVLIFSHLVSSPKQASAALFGHFFLLIFSIWCLILIRKAMTIGQIESQGTTQNKSPLYLFIASIPRRLLGVNAFLSIPSFLSLSENFLSRTQWLLVTKYNGIQSSARINLVKYISYLLQDGVYRSIDLANPHPDCFSILRHSGSSNSQTKYITYFDGSQILSYCQKVNVGQ